MINKISQSDFNQAFIDYGREDQFSQQALVAIYEFMEEVSPEWELDVIALCCDFCEYDDLEEVQYEYDHIESIDDLNDHTLVLATSSGGLVIQQF